MAFAFWEELKLPKHHHHALATKHQNWCISQRSFSKCSSDSIWKRSVMKWSTNWNSMGFICIAYLKHSLFSKCICSANFSILVLELVKIRIFMTFENWKNHFENAIPFWQLLSTPFYTLGWCCCCILQFCIYT